MMQVGMSSLPSQLAVIESEIWHASSRACRIAEAASDRQMARPGPGKWCAAECLQHLVLTTDAFLPRFQQGFEELREKGLHGEGPFRMEWTARLLRFILEPPARLKTGTGAAFQPVPIEDPQAVLPAFLASQGRLMEALSEGAGLALDRVKMESPFSSRVKYNLYSAFVLVAVHERRHLWQAEEALKQAAGRG
jgi:hypothetical protein